MTNLLRFWSIGLVTAIIACGGQTKSNTGNNAAGNGGSNQAGAGGNTNGGTSNGGTGTSGTANGGTSSGATGGSGGDAGAGNSGGTGNTAGIGGTGTAGTNTGGSAGSTICDEGMPCVGNSSCDGIPPEGDCYKKCWCLNNSYSCDVTCGVGGASGSSGAAGSGGTSGCVAGVPCTNDFGCAYQGPDGCWITCGCASTGVLECDSSCGQGAQAGAGGSGNPPGCPPSTPPSGSMCGLDQLGLQCSYLPLTTCTCVAMEFSAFWSCAF